LFFFDLCSFFFFFFFFVFLAFNFIALSDAPDHPVPFQGGSLAAQPRLFLSSLPQTPQPPHQHSDQYVRIGVATYTFVLLLSWYLLHFSFWFLFIYICVSLTKRRYSLCVPAEEAAEMRPLPQWTSRPNWMSDPESRHALVCGAPTPATRTDPASSRSGHVMRPRH